MTNPPVRCGANYCLRDETCCGLPPAQYCCIEEEIEIRTPPIIIITAVSIGSFLLFLGVTGLLIRCLCKKRPTAGRVTGARIHPINNKTHPTTVYPQGHIVPPPNVLQGGVNQTPPIIGQHPVYPPGQRQAPHPHQMHAMQSVEPPNYHTVTARPQDPSLQRENGSLEIAYPPGHVPPPFDYKPPFTPPGWQIYN